MIRLRHGAYVPGEPDPDPDPNPDPPTGAAPLGWLLDTTNTGLAAAGVDPNSLPVYTGPTQVPAGTTISLKRIEGPLELDAGGITIDRCWIRPTAIGLGLPVMRTCGSEQNLVPPTPVTVQYCDIDGSLLSGQAAAFTLGFYGIGHLIRNRVWGMGSGLAIIQSGQQLSATVEGNYVHGLVAWGDGSTSGNHSDGFTIRGFNPASNPNRLCTVKNNRFDCRSGNDSGAFFIQPNADNIGNVHVEGNLLEGGGYNLVMEDNNGVIVGNMTADNNRFNPTGFGPGYTSSNIGWESFTNGYRWDPDNPPTYAGSPVIL